jgi:phosphate acetyltransferase
MTKGMEPIPIAVAHPCDTESLRGPLQARDAGLVIPVLVGPEAKIREVAEREASICAACASSTCPTATPRRPPPCAGPQRRGRGADEGLAAHRRADERGGRPRDRPAHRAPPVPRVHGRRATYPHPLLITDAAINIEPTLEDKVHIIQNAIELAIMMGVPEPKVAILSAVETVNVKIRSTLDAAALCKMADRGQIKGGLLDGPLAFDNAVSLVAAKTKGIRSAVAGQADILVVPDLESGNMVAKQLEYLADALMAGVVLGARVPIVLTSRADTAETRTASCAIAQLMAHKRRQGVRL